MAGWCRCDNSIRVKHGAKTESTLSATLRPNHWPKFPGQRFTRGQCNVGASIWIAVRHQAIDYMSGPIGVVATASHEAYREINLRTGGIKRVTRQSICGNGAFAER